MLQQLFLLFIVISVSFIAADRAAIARLLKQREDSLAILHKAAEDAALTRCSDVKYWKPDNFTCQIAGCGNSFPASMGFECRTDFGLDPELCGTKSSVCGGLSRAFAKSTLLFAPQTNYQDERAIEFVTMTDRIDAVASQLLESRQMKAWAGFGSITGIHRVWPGNVRSRNTEQCRPYDPRRRGWYVAASSGPTDIILVIDNSGSLFQSDCRGCKPRLDLMQDAANSLIDLLTFNSFFAVVTFNSPDSGQIVTANGNATLLRGTDANKAVAQEAVKNLRATGLTNFQTGFEKAFEIFRTSTTETSNCTRIILFLTDGSANDYSTIDSYIASQQATLGSNPARIFTFTMSSGASKEKPRDIACAWGGVHSHIPNGVNPITAMGQFYRFLSIGTQNAKNSSDRKIATDIYEDNFGLSFMTTVASPVIYRSPESIANPKLIAPQVGVMSIDIPVGEFLELGTEEELIAELRSRGDTCYPVNISDCYMQLLRNESGYECPGFASLEECKLAGNVSDLFPSCDWTPLTQNPVLAAGGLNALTCESLDFEKGAITKNVAPMSEREVSCCNCELRASVILGIILGSVSFVAVVGIIVGWYLIAVKGYCVASKTISTAAPTAKDNTMKNISSSSKTQVENLQKHDNVLEKINNEEEEGDEEELKTRVENKYEVGEVQ